MMHSKDFNFSFSGLKTAVLYFVQKQKKLTDELKTAIAREFQNAVVGVITHKTKKAIEKYKIKTLVVGGGVSANTEIKKALSKMTKEYKVEILFPEKKLAMDNAIMIAIAGYFRRKDAKKNLKMKAIGNLRLDKMI